MRLHSTVVLGPLPETSQASKSDELPLTVVMESSEKYIAQSFSDGSVYIISNTRDAKESCLGLVHPRGVVTGIAFNDDTILLASDSDTHIRLYDAISCQPLNILSCSCQQPFLYVLTTPFQDTESRSRLALGFHHNGTVCSWDLVSGAYSYTLRLHRDLAYQQCFSGESLVTGSANGTVSVANWRTGTQKWLKHTGSDRKENLSVMSMAILDDKVAVGMQDGNIWVGRLDDGVEITQWRNEHDPVQYLMPYRDYLVEASWGLIRIWSTTTWELQHSIRIFDCAFDSLAIIDNTLVCAGRDASVAEDVCGLDEGLKAWNIEWNNDEDVNTCSPRVFRLGAPTVQARSLTSLHDQVSVAIFRRGVWQIEIWGKDLIESETKDRTLNVG